MLVLACRPGITNLAPTTWIERLRSGDDVIRKQAIGNPRVRSVGTRPWVWRETAVLSWFGFDASSWTCALRMAYGSDWIGRYSSRVSKIASGREVSIRCAGCCWSAFPGSAG